MVTPKRQRNPLPSSTPFHVAAERYIEDGGEEHYLSPILKYFGRKITIGEIDKAAIDTAVAVIGPHLAKNSAHRQIVSPIKVILNHAFDTGRKRGQGKPPPRWLTPDEAAALISAARNPGRIGLRDPHLRTLQKIAFMLGTGAMPGEAIVIKPSAQDPTTGAWALPGIPSIVQPRRVLPPLHAVDLIGDLPTSGPAFLAPNGEPYVVRNKGGGQMAEAFSQVCAAAGLGREVTPATCRTTWAVWLYAQAQDIEPLIALGGWTGPRSAKPLTRLAETGLDQWLFSHGWDFREQIASHQNARS